MPVYKAPVQDTLFILNDVLQIAQSDLRPYRELSPEIIAAITEECGRFASEVLAPLNLSGDQEGCIRSSDGAISTPHGFKGAYALLREAGWGTLIAPSEYGGQGLPHVLGFVAEEYLSGANQSLAMYPGLASGAIAALSASASDELKQRFLPKMVSGEWLGTMNLTEPQCGTDLGLIRTKALAQADGSYAISGAKIFISAGDHDLTENIVHLVLARTANAPEGSWGISLFLVPKLKVREDGSLGELNGVSCSALEHKMGIHGNATCAMHFEKAQGYLVGQENSGLAAMFVMMNAARLGVGLQGVAQAEAAYQNAVSYALERRQGRALTGAEDAEENADLLIVHPDVRRMLMEGRAWIEGLRALALFCGMQEDAAHFGANAESQAMGRDLVALLTPIVKGFGTDKGFATTVAMQQIWGGHGYITENGMDQFVRDARITMIYEGANGVQAMDLVGRKLPAAGGKAIRAFMDLVDEECTDSAPELEDLSRRLKKANEELKAGSYWLMQHGITNPNQAGAGAYAYMHMLGYVAVGLMWLKMAKAASKKMLSKPEDAGFLQAKLVTARFYAERLLLYVGALRRELEAGSESVMALSAEDFRQGR